MELNRRVTDRDINAALTYAKDLLDKAIDRETKTIKRTLTPTDLNEYYCAGKTIYLNEKDYRKLMGYSKLPEMPKLVRANVTRKVKPGAVGYHKALDVLTQ